MALLTLLLKIVARLTLSIMYFIYEGASLVFTETAVTVMIK